MEKLLVAQFVFNMQIGSSELDKGIHLATVRNVWRRPPKLQLKASRSHRQLLMGVSQPPNDGSSRLSAPWQTAVYMQGFSHQNTRKYLRQYGSFEIMSVIAVFI
jgi:hypothetical protein